MVERIERKKIIDKIRKNKNRNYENRQENNQNKMRGKAKIIYVMQKKERE